ncbi:MAG: sulfite oxidase [Magnetococcales bacterium]|nr:sulfite oxidase [Magnetococcales bacterium]MBF0438379.1 sulfite oxidase [Magnetococcales bacterium]
MNDNDHKSQVSSELFQKFAEDPVKADLEVFGRVTNEDRRGFLKGAGLATMTAMLGAAIPFADKMPFGLIPVALAEEALKIDGKEGLISLGDKPLNAETPAYLLNDDITPTKYHFIRNHSTVPEDLNPDTWTLTIDGEVENPLKLTIAELKKQFKTVSEQLVIECGGNGRAFFNPQVKGNQWTVGAVGCAKWTGVRLADILKVAKVKKSAIYTAHYGADMDLADPTKFAVSRGIPIDKALDPHTLVAFMMNDAPIHPQNGAPLRLVVPGWVGSTSHKWLKRIQLRDVVHDGKGMTKRSYRMPNRPLEPGEEVGDEIFTKIITSMPVKSLITAPASRHQVTVGKPVEIRGHAWAGENEVKEMMVSIDFGASWIKAKLTKPANRFAWQHWSVAVTFPVAGYYEVWARATDSKDNTQPFAVAWNPNGYLGNAMHRIALRVA